ncbi:MAG: C4-type zinc ribbon domain-containing protein [Phycisphaeraceae bacterium]
MSLQDQLYQLYLLDQNVRGLSSRLDAARSRLKSQTSKLQQLTQQRNELNEQVKLATARASTLEHEADGIEARITELRTRMNSVTSNKEYSALLVEINTIKIDKGKKEDETLKQMEDRDRLAAQHAEAATKVEGQQKLVTQSEKEVAQRLAEVGEKLDEVTKERDAAATSIPPEPLATFNKALHIHDGEAMAVVVDDDGRSRDFTCGGCYMGIPIERVNAVLSRKNDLITCPSCGRILYAGEHLKSTMAAK